MGIDLRKIPLGLTQKSISELEIKSHSLRSVLDFLLATANYKDNNSNTSPLKTRKIKEDQEVRNKLPKSVIADIIGPLNLKIDNLTLCCSFLAGREPKIYFLPYFLFAQGVGGKLTVWIDDIIARFKYQRTITEQSKVNIVYKEALKRFCINITFSSEYFKDLIIPNWIVLNVKALDWTDFFSLLPYGKRKMAFAKVLDMIHYLWFTTIIANCDQDYFLTSINTMAMCQLTLKTIGTKRNFIFIPKAPIESGDPRIYTLERPVLDKLDKETIEYLFNFYKLKHPEYTKVSFFKKITLLKNYALGKER